MEVYQWNNVGIKNGEAVVMEIDGQNLKNGQRKNQYERG